VGAPPAIVNAIVDALSHLGVKHIDIPVTPEKVWRILKDKGWRSRREAHVFLHPLTGEGVAL